LTGTASTTERLANGTLTVRAPLAGGRVERAIVSGLQEYSAAEADLITEWANR
jgi:hypothetical protein